MKSKKTFLVNVIRRQNSPWINRFALHFKRVAVRRAQNFARHRPVEGPVLYIDDHMHDQRLVLRWRKGRALARHLKRYSRIGHGTDRVVRRDGKNIAGARADPTRHAMLRFVDRARRPDADAGPPSPIDQLSFTQSGRTSFNGAGSIQSIALSLLFTFFSEYRKAASRLRSFTSTSSSTIV